jgi:hypothetical protein
MILEFSKPQAKIVGSENGLTEEEHMEQDQEDAVFNPIFSTNAVEGNMDEEETMISMPLD